MTPSRHRLVEMTDKVQDDNLVEVDVEEAPSSVSAEFPAVRLGDSGDSITPRRRLLLGRVHEAWALYPAYGMEIVAGSIAVLFAAQSPEWAAVPVGLTWFLLYVWVWFYGVAYRYRRRFFRYFSFFILMVSSAAVAFLCFDRAFEQMAYDGEVIAMRAAEPTLVWAAILTIGAALLITVHVAYLGRGYRERKVDT